MRFYNEDFENSKEPKFKKIQKIQKFAEIDQFLNLSSDSDAARSDKKICAKNRPGWPTSA